MMHVVDNMRQASAMLSASHAIAVVSVPWSPWPRKSRQVLAALGSTRGHWSPDSFVEFFDLWPERDGELNRWYDALCASASPWFELHGHGYGPLWWLASGKVLECITKPYEYSLEELQQRSAAVFRGSEG
jgi:hypothetical protein